MTTHSHSARQASTVALTPASVAPIPPARGRSLSPEQNCVLAEEFSKGFVGKFWRQGLDTLQIAEKLGRRECEIDALISLYMNAKYQTRLMKKSLDTSGTDATHYRQSQNYGAASEDFPTTGF